MDFKDATRDDQCFDSVNRVQNLALLSRQTLLDRAVRALKALAWKRVCLPLSPTCLTATCSFSLLGLLFHV